MPACADAVLRVGRQAIWSESWGVKCAFSFSRLFRTEATKTKPASFGAGLNSCLPCALPACIRLFAHSRNGCALCNGEGDRDDLRHEVKLPDCRCGINEMPRLLREINAQKLNGSYRQNRGCRFCGLTTRRAFHYLDIHEAAVPSTPSSSPCDARVGGVVLFVEISNRTQTQPADAHRIRGLFA